MAKVLTKQEERAKLTKRAGTLYRRKGASVRSVAKELGLAYSTTHKYIHEAGVPIKKRSGTTWK